VGFGMNAPSVILQLNSQGVSPMAFSHCLTSSDDGGSILVLGEVVMPLPGFVFTPLVPSRSVFFFRMLLLLMNFEGQNSALSILICFITVFLFLNWR
jgi:hypothetical protein